MKVHLNYKFYHERYQISHDIFKHKTFNEINNSEKALLKELIILILNNHKVWGRNKKSFDSFQIQKKRQTTIITSQEKLINSISNFNKFKLENFFHIHLLDQKDNMDTDQSKFGVITDYSSNEKNKNTSNTIVHYKIEDDTIIIYSVSEHGNGQEWNELSYLTMPYAFWYTKCECGEIYCDDELYCPSCPSQKKIFFNSNNESINTDISTKVGHSRDNKPIMYEDASDLFYLDNKEINTKKLKPINIDVNLDNINTIFT